MFYASEYLSLLKYTSKYYGNLLQAYDKRAKLKLPLVEKRNDSVTLNRMKFCLQQSDTHILNDRVTFNTGNKFTVNQI
jgi:hypothetical protein